MEPLPNETESAFLARFHESMRDRVPDTDARNKAALDTWRRFRDASDLEQRAARQFPDSEFVHVRDVPVFAEHDTVGRDGKPVKYDRPALEKIIERCNHRIADTGDFAALCFGHTPEAEEAAKGAPMPELGGFAGPFRLGMIGRVQPRWAILQDEHHYRHKADRIRETPRRSPEVWLSADMADRYMDPIALLGAEAPRLDMGMRYCRTAGGRLVEKYAATFPGPAAVSRPDDTRRDDYDADSLPQEREMALSTEDIQQITAALMESAPMKWVAEQMKAEAAPQPDDIPGDPDAADIPDETPEKPDDAGEWHDKMAKMATKYSKMAGELDQVRAENKALKERLDASEHKTRKAERYSQLAQAAQVAVLDIDEEMTRVEKMSDAQFDGHMQVILEKYSRIPVNAGLYIPGEVAGGAKPETEKYRKECAAKAREFVISERAAGRDASYETALAKAKAGQI